MGISEDNQLRLSAQRALLDHVTPRLRAVSLDVDVDLHYVVARFIFDGEPGESARDAAACAGTEILADCPLGWDITEEFVICPAPSKMAHLRLLVYHRCEDAWVTDVAPVPAASREPADRAEGITRDETKLLENVLDCLDRVFDRDCTVMDLHALLYATSKALTRSRFRDHIEPFVGPLREIIRTKPTPELRREKALEVTDDMRKFLASVLPRPQARRGAVHSRACRRKSPRFRPR